MVLVQLVLLHTPDADLADRLEATWDVDAAAAEEAVALLLDDARFLAAPSMLVPSGELGTLATGDDEQELSVQLVPVLADDDVAVSMEIARRVGSDPWYYRFDLDVLDGGFTAASRGDLTVVVRPLVDPDEADLDALALDGRDPELRPRARRRAIDALLVE
ncbi:MAG: hypothetical protein R3F59_26980 [Myxococcota bacterium]